MSDWHAGAYFTVELGCLVENGFDLGLDDYPIFDEDYRPILNRKIIDHYWFREIGAETPAVFRRFLRRTLNEVMPFYNEMYKSTQLQINPLANVEYWHTGTRSDEGASKRTDDYTDTRNETASTTSDSTTESDGTTVNYAFPQIRLAGNEDYAQSMAETESIGKSAGTTQASTDAASRNVGESVSDSSNTTDYAEHIAGLQGITGAEAIMRFRDAIVNVDVEVLYSLEPCFMQIWNPGRNYY